MWLNRQAAWEEQEEILRSRMAPMEERRMHRQEEQRRKEIGMTPVKKISPEEHFAQPAVLQRFISDTIRRIQEYPKLIKGLLSLPDDVLAELAAKNAIGETQWGELKENLNVIPMAIDAFNQKVTT